jgi:hypothetical protein
MSWSIQQLTRPQRSAICRRFGVYRTVPHGAPADSLVGGGSPRRWGDLDVHDLVVEQPVLGRGGGALVGRRRELVLFGAADVESLPIGFRAPPTMTELA